jgi:uncharacterized protein (UPF0335 family)
MGSEEHVRRMKDDAEKDPTKFAKEQLKAFVHRIEHINAERKELSNDVRDVYAEAKANGYSTKALKRVIRAREYDREHGADARKSEEAIYELYLETVGPGQ